MLHSCNDGDGSSYYGKTWEALATIQPTGEIFYNLILDNGDILQVNNPRVIYEEGIKQRVYVNYTYGDERATEPYPVYVNWQREILTKDLILITEENDENIGDDPIIIKSMWFGDDYLNIYFELKGTGSSIHAINLGQVIRTDAQPDGKIHLQLRHNANGAEDFYTRKSYAAFDFRPYKELITEDEPLTFSIRYKDYNNEYIIRETVYKFEDTDMTVFLSEDNLQDATLFR